MEKALGGCLVNEKVKVQKKYAWVTTGQYLQKVQVKGIYKPVELTKILYVPDLAKNLFSIGAVVKMGLSFVFKEDNCFILNNDGEIFGSGRKERKLFILDCLPLNESMHGANGAIP